MSESNAIRVRNKRPVKMFPGDGQWVVIDKYSNMTAVDRGEEVFRWDVSCETNSGTVRRVFQSSEFIVGFERVDFHNIGDKLKVNRDITNKEVGIDDSTLPWITRGDWVVVEGHYDQDVNLHDPMYICFHRDVPNITFTLKAKDFEGYAPEEEPPIHELPLWSFNRDMLQDNGHDGYALTNDQFKSLVDYIIEEAYDGDAISTAISEWYEDNTLND